MERPPASQLLPTVLVAAGGDQRGMSVPTVLLPSQPGGRFGRRGASRRVARFWQLLLLALAAAGVTGFLSRALA